MIDPKATIYLGTNKSPPPLWGTDKSGGGALPAESFAINNIKPHRKNKWKSNKIEILEKKRAADFHPEDLKF